MQHRWQFRNAHKAHLLTLTREDGPGGSCSIHLDDPMWPMEDLRLPDWRASDIQDWVRGVGAASAFHPDGGGDVAVLGDSPFRAIHGVPAAVADAMLPALVAMLTAAVEECQA